MKKSLIVFIFLYSAIGYAQTANTSQFSNSQLVKTHFNCAGLGYAVSTWLGYLEKHAQTIDLKSYYADLNKRFDSKFNDYLWDLYKKDFDSKKKSFEQFLNNKTLDKYVKNNQENIRIEISESESTKETKNIINKRIWDFSKCIKEE